MMFKKKQKIKSTRRQKRMQADYLMMYQEIGGNEAEPFIANIKDLSSSGCRFLTEYFFREGTDLDLSIAIPPLNRSIRCRSRVLRIRPSSRALYYVGVRFLDLAKEDTEAIEDFIETLSKDRKAWFMVDHEDKVTRKEEIKEIYS